MKYFANIFQLYRRYGVLGLVRLSADIIISKIMYGSKIRIIRRPCYIRGFKRMRIGESFTSGVGLRMDAFSDSGVVIRIGDRVQVNDYVHIAATDLIKIGHDVLIASKVFITDHGHGRYSGSQEHSDPETPPYDRVINSAPVIIEDKVWIGENVVILPGVTIGEGSVIGASSVVTKSVPKRSVAGGNPCSIIKIFDEESGRWEKK